MLSIYFICRVKGYSAITFSIAEEEFLPISKSNTWLIFCTDSITLFMLPSLTVSGEEINCLPFFKCRWLFISHYYSSNFLFVPRGRHTGLYLTSPTISLEILCAALFSSFYSANIIYLNQPYTFNISGRCFEHIINSLHRVNFITKGYIVSIENVTAISIWTVFATRLVCLH